MKSRRVLSVIVTLIIAIGLVVSCSQPTAGPGEDESEKTLIIGTTDEVNSLDARDAYATVEALTSGCRVWAYASVIDGTSGSPGTNDPTLIPLTVVD